MSEAIICEQRGPIATLILNRAEKHNAMSPEMLLMMRDHMQRLEAEGETRVLIIRGAGDVSFTSGFDISRLPERREDDEVRAPRQGPSEFDQMLQALRAFSTPVIAMIHGFCMGGGLELAAMCDVRFTADTGQFCMPPARLGVLYSGAGLQRFVNLIGVANTSEIFFAAMTFDAERALEIGLVNRVLAPDELEAQTEEMAQQIARNAPLSVMYTKRVLSMVQSHQDFSTHADEMQRLREACAQSDDFQEGRRAFLEKRSPVFRGR